MVQHSQGATPLLMHWRHASPELRPLKRRHQALDYLNLVISLSSSDNNNTNDERMAPFKDESE